ncbi:phosphoglucosamine mutase [Rhodothalassium salexigens]|uniref:phosphoglucosamine mutase n=1 Tax=Rhodothalassium salexigens TaxID=1086 RepID=UPI001911F74D|nr:phosphoglucosamine mutase [Rhodothalassium salexigens]MBK5910520.1 phosphoglucosamine mutase [Rhodothalassium salexigens]MBK5919849.1 phosphoglucosamine mutase [Rhodothalassium salexigens]
MTRRLFGTDGIRGYVNQPPMTPDMALRLGLSAGRLFRRQAQSGRVVIGKDTRRSGYMLESALTAGFVAAGMDVTQCGPIPTPGVAMLTHSLRADLGVMISASHNPHHDNGIKLFGPDGYKLSDAREAEIEAHMANGWQDGLAAPDRLGHAAHLDDARGRYIEFAKRTVPQGLTFEGLKVVLDCANGAAYRVAPAVLWELGAEVTPLGVTPNGVNINERCGSTDTAALRDAVVGQGADLGVALDGDADRVILVDQTGRTIDGDQLMALILDDWHARGCLKGGGLVATVMSNLGLERFVSARGLRLERTKVGDRYVVEAMRRQGINLGGEQSGHIILNDFTTTGDGLLAALQVLTVIARSGRPASEVTHMFDPVPQVLRSVCYQAADPLACDTVRTAISAGEDRLRGNGRLVIRKSGTEPKVRVMAEGDDEALVAAVVDDICARVETAA